MARSGVVWRQRVVAGGEVVTRKMMFVGEDAVDNVIGQIIQRFDLPPS